MIRCIVFTKIDKMDSKHFFLNEFYRCRGNTLTMCEFRKSTCNGFGDIWWTDNPIYFSSIDRYAISHYLVDPDVPCTCGRILLQNCWHPVGNEVNRRFFNFGS